MLAYAARMNKGKENKNRAEWKSIVDWFKPKQKQLRFIHNVDIGFLLQQFADADKNCIL